MKIVLLSASQTAACVGKNAMKSAALADKATKAAAAHAAAGKGKGAHRHSSYNDEKAVLADEPIRINTPAGSCHSPYYVR